VGIALLLMAFGMSPTQAAAAPAAAQTSAGKTSAAASKHTARTARPCGTAVQRRISTRCVVNGPQQFSEGGCGFLQRCVYLNRSEQLYVISGSKWIVQAALCAAGVGIGCLVAGGIVELAAQWLMSRGGICPTSKPRLRVRYFPAPQIEGCVA
jgi:hypothetical protein